MKEIPWKTIYKRTHVISEAVNCLNVCIFPFYSLQNPSAKMAGAKC